MQGTIPAIFVVEDEKDILMVLRRLLLDLRLDYDIVIADNGADALVQAGRRACHLLITDYMLADQTGLDIARRIKAQWQCPVIMITAYETDALRSEAEANGVDVLLPKPFRAEMLEQAVRSLL